MSQAKLSQRKRTKRAAEIAKVLEIIDDNEVAPTSITVKFNYSRGGELPDNISHLLHYAPGLNIDVAEEYSELVFHFGREKKGPMHL